jgi:hydrogenase nickel incorporation protein HypA/HybF
MHELAITQAVVDAVVQRTGGAGIGAVRLEIGKLSGVVPDSVRFCFDLVAEGTPLHGARLEIVEPPGRGRCRDCAAAFDVDDPIVLCPGCDSADVEVLAGRDLRIISVEVRATCAAPAAVPARQPR